MIKKSFSLESPISNREHERGSSKTRQALAALSVGLTVAIFGANLAQESRTHTPSENFTERIVNNDDTVWDFADEVRNPDNIDRRDVVATIIDLSPDLHNGTDAGDIALIPDEIRK